MLPCWWTSGFAFFILLFARKSLRDNPFTGLTLFYVFAAGWGPDLSSHIKAISSFVGPNAIYEAAAITALGMGVIGIIAYLSSIDFREFTMPVFMLLLLLLFGGLVNMFHPFLQTGVFSWMTLGIFTLLVVIDFQRIFENGQYRTNSAYRLTAVDLAVDIFLDAFIIFDTVLELAGLRMRK